MKNHMPSWLKDAIIYEIYPQSFYDSNGDGIGDIPGIIRKLDYIESLGCNAIWLNPCFESPFRDAGYDISDYYKVAPRYGTNADLVRLFKESYKRKIRVILDLVPGHTSIDHPWFKASAEPGRNKYSNWYIWTDNGWSSPPQGLDGIRGFSERYGQYIANFFYSQPALNYGFAKPDPKYKWQMPCDHPDVKAVRNELKNIIRFWLDKGASGFRVDMAASLVKFDKDKKETGKLWREIRAMLDRDYPEAVLISEWSWPLQSINSGFHVDMLLSDRENQRVFRWPCSWDDKLDYSGSFFSREGRGDISEFIRLYDGFYSSTKNKGYISFITGNHDTVRINHRRGKQDLEMIFAFILFMPGIPVIYYGDEIGMRHMDGIHSKEGGYGRTAARTPMQWGRGKNAGFSEAPASKLYLPVDPDPRRPDIEQQARDDESLLNSIKKMICFRRSWGSFFADSGFKVLYCAKKKYPFVFSRAMEGRTVIVAFNPSEKPVNVRLKLKNITAGSLKRKMGWGCGLTFSRGLCLLDMKGVSYGLFRVE
jgi:glycosidase